MQKLLNYDEHVFRSTVAQPANNPTHGLSETPPISHNSSGIHLGSSTVKWSPEKTSKPSVGESSDLTLYG
jgi:hypothetical protein